MQMVHAHNKVTLALEKEEALVLFEMLQRLVEEDEKSLLPLLHSSAEFAVLCRLNSHLEKSLSEPFCPDYDTILMQARGAIIKQSGYYQGIEEQ